MRRLVGGKGGKARKDPALMDSLGRASTMGLHMVSGIIVGGLIGYWLDEWLDTGPWLKVVFFPIGVAAGFRNVYLDAKLLMKTQDDTDGNKSEKAD
ncbi:AtpZ/AtpI family protein [Desulfovibrio sp. OttesenSCG-928-C06]|nr:AtpZ/AtpI family protein [Desulfovibrio sp. OttesenSCG-928-C06]